MTINYLLLPLLLFDVLLAACFTGLLFKKIETLKLIAISLSFFFTGYILCSGAFFLLDSFQFTGVLITEAVCFIAGIAAIVLKEKKFAFSVENKKRSAVIYLIIICGLIISLPKFTFFGMGQDQGVYQTKAIALANGYTQRQFDFEEYSLLETDEQKETYNQAVKGLVGLYPYDALKPTCPPEDQMSPVSGFFHGIPTFPAILGLAVKIFGVSAMQHVHSMFFLCAMLFTLFTVENLSLKKPAQYLALSVVALCPIIQWVMKSALTEGFLTLIFAWFIYHITDKEYKFSPILSAVPICAFAFFHVTIFTMIPLFICVFVISYEETKDRGYIYAGLLSLVFFVLGNAMMMYTCPRYTTNNISRSTRILSDFTIFPVFLAVSIVVAVVFIFIDKLRVDRIYQWIKGEKVFSLILRIVFAISIIGVLLFKFNGTVLVLNTSVYFKQLTLVVFICGTGFIALPAAIYMIIKSPNKMLASKNTLLITAMLFYCVILMSAFIRREVPYAYYYSRYLAPFIVVCAVTIGMVLDRLSVKYIYVITACTVAFLLPYNWVLFTQNDDSRIEWDTLSDIKGVITENSAVVIDSGYRLSMMLPIKLMTGADIYPVFEDAEEQLELLSANYKEVFIVKSSFTSVFDNIDTDRFVDIYISNNKWSEDRGLTAGLISPFPMAFIEQETVVEVSKYYKDVYEYDFVQYDIMFSGGDKVEEESYRWVLGNGMLTAFLSEKDYTMNVDIAFNIPLHALDRDSVRVDISVNDKFLATHTITMDNLSEDIQVDIPKEYMVDGPNSISFSGDSWSPTEYGYSDSRTLLIPISKITFEEKVM